jgi:hypothetical protein
VMHHAGIRPRFWRSGRKIASARAVYSSSPAL